jgi:hypothetical protein
MIFRRCRAVSESGSVVEQDREALRGAASDAPAQLVHLREAHALGVLDHHQVALGTSTPDLDHGGGDKHWIAFGLECRHHLSAFSAGFMRPWTRPTERSGNVALMVSKVSIAVCSCSCSDSSISGQTQ